MNIAIGFGSTEEQAEQSIKNDLAEIGLEATKEKWNKQADINDKLPKEEAPERYTRFWYYDNTIKYHHINRRHALSPDGWALLQTEEPFGVKD